MIWSCSVHVEFESRTLRSASLQRSAGDLSASAGLSTRRMTSIRREPKYVCRCADPAGRASAGARRSLISAQRTAQRQERRQRQRPWLQDAAVRRGSRLPGTARRGRTSGCRRKPCRQPIKKRTGAQRPADEASDVVSGARAPERPTGTATAGDCPAGRTMEHRSMPNGPWNTDQCRTDHGTPINAERTMENRSMPNEPWNTDRFRTNHGEPSMSEDP
jgi:hypothetical protein